MKEDFTFLFSTNDNEGFHWNFHFERHLDSIHHLWDGSYFAAKFCTSSINVPFHHNVFNLFTKDSASVFEGETPAGGNTFHHKIGYKRKDKRLQTVQCYNVMKSKKVRSEMNNGKIDHASTSQKRFYWSKKPILMSYAAHNTLENFMKYRD